MFKSIGLKIMLKTIGYCLPFLRKFIYPLEQFKKDFSIDVSTNEGSVTINLTEENPEIRIGFNAINKSEYLNISLDRMTVSLSFVYQILADAPMIKACEICKKGEQYVSFVAQLNSFQRNMICDVINKGTSHDAVSIDIWYYIKSDFYTIPDMKHLGRRHCKINNKPSVRVS